MLRRPELRAPLVARLPGVRRLVLLGDVLELRHGPQRDALAVAEPVLADLGAALGDGEVLLIPGNHDHPLLAPWLARRRAEREPPALGLAEEVDHRPGEGLHRLAAAVGPARLRVAYPGAWLRPDVYATHGHYLDLHTTIPTFERIACGAMKRIAGAPPLRRAVPDDYQAAVEPLYAWIDALAQAAPGEGGAAHGFSARLWRRLAAAGGRRPVGWLALRTGMAATIAALNRAGLGPLRGDLSGPALRRAGLRAMGEALTRLGVRADWALFGHTHRSGPWPADEDGEWQTAGGTRLLNTGSWLYERDYVTPNPYESPYWPGVACEVDADGPPRLVRLLGYRSDADLRPGAAPG